MSIACLGSLGLISVDFLTNLSDESAYKPFAENGLYKSTEALFHLPTKPPHLSDVLSIGMQKGLAQTTALGKQFIKICCPV